MSIIGTVRRLFHLRDPVVMEPPGPPNVYLTTDDIDKTTGKPYLDYLERRVLRAKAREGYGKDLGDLHPGDHEGWESHPK